MNFSGCHGTKKECAELIIKNELFEKSNSDEDWLGSGVYFYNNIDNAIDYNIKKYLDDNTAFFLNYGNLRRNYSIITCNIIADEEYILDFNKHENKLKLIIATRKLIDKIKLSDKFNELEYKDGLIINMMRKHTGLLDKYKIITNIFTKQIVKKSRVEYKDRIKRRKTTRIAFEIKQLYICVIDQKCIYDFNLYNDNYEKQYNIIIETYKQAKKGDELWTLQI